MRIEIRDKDNFIKMFNKMYPNINLSSINGITIDSRKIMKNDIYLPIKGKNFDGHDFINSSLLKGAVIAFSEKNGSNKKLIKTNSILNEIITLCKNWKKLSKAKIIGITGSNGKTTTKNIIYKILKKKYNCTKTIGNFNSTIGLPITFLNSKLNDDYCILEYGASKPNEIKYLCNIISPDFSYITNISHSHIGNFNSFEELNETKKFLYYGTNKTGKCFINNDLINVNMNLLRKNYLEFSLSKKSNLKCEFISNNNQNYLLINNKKIYIPSELIHIKDNILGAYIIAYFLGINHNEIIDAINSFELPKGRGNILNYNNFRLLDDSYNANPASIKLAIKRLNTMKTKGKKILVLADMLELGDIAKEEHRNISNLINTTNIDIIITYGNLTKITQKHLSKNKYSKHYKNKNKMKIDINNLVCKDDVIYLKGSRGMGLEYIYNNN